MGVHREAQRQVPRPYRDPLGRHTVRDVHAARPTPSASSGRCEVDMDRGQLDRPARRRRRRSRSGPRSSCRCAGGWRRRRRRPTGATSTGTSCPRFGAYRLGRLPADEIENWLNDELAAGLAPSSVHRHYRTLRRMLQVAVEKQKLLSQPVRPRPPAPGADAGHGRSSTGTRRCASPRPTHERFRALIYLAVDTGMRWSELVGLAPREASICRRRQGPSHRAADPARGRLVVRSEPKTTAGVRSITISPVTAAMLLATTSSAFARPGPTRSVFPNGAGNPLSSSSFRSHHFRRRSARPACRAGSTTCATPASRWPSPRAPTRRRSRPGWATLDHRHPRPLRPPLPRARRGHRRRLRRAPGGGPPGPT